MPSLMRIEADGAGPAKVVQVLVAERCKQSDQNETQGMNDATEGERPVEPAVTVNAIDNVKDGNVKKEARDDSNDIVEPTTRTASVEVADEATVNDTQPITVLQSDTDDTNDTSPFYDDDEEDPVYPHPLTSINNNVLARFLMAPFHAYTMKLLRNHKHKKEWDTVLRPLNMPIINQKQCVQQLRRRLKDMDGQNKKMSTRTFSPLDASSQHNSSMATNTKPQDALPPQNVMNHMQFRQHHPVPVNTTESNESFPLDRCKPNPIHNNLPSNFYPSITHNAPPPHRAPITFNASHKPLHLKEKTITFNTDQSSKNKTSAAPRTGSPYPQLTPPELNNGNMNKDKQSEMMQSRQGWNAACNTTNLLPVPSVSVLIPQALASKPSLVNDSNIQSIAKLPITFGFQLNNDRARIAAQAHTQSWSQRGRDALYSTSNRCTSKPKTDKTKTVRKSLSTTRNKSSKKSPILVPTPADKTMGLPEGWTTKTYKRTKGNSVGNTDTYFYSPEDKIKFRSKKNVMIFSKIVEEVRWDEKKAFEVYNERGHRH